MANQSLSLNREHLAWAAGFFDGEGHSRKGDRSLAVTISQADSPDLLERFRRAVGVGTIRGPYTHRARPKQRPFYVYDALGYENVQHCLCVMWPWLGSVKRKQAMLALVSWRQKPRKWFRSVDGSRKTCFRGHAVEGDNAYIAKSGFRACKECRRISQRKGKAARIEHAMRCA